MHEYECRWHRTGREGATRRGCPHLEDGTELFGGDCPSAQPSQGHAHAKGERLVACGAPDHLLVGEHLACATSGHSAVRLG
eukprot:3216980-Prymnesium_polylepis.1